MFEIGVAIGLGIPVITVRDTTLAADQRQFKDIGLLDTLGFVSFTNSNGLASAIGLGPPFLSLCRRSRIVIFEPSPSTCCSLRYAPTDRSH